MRNIFRKGRPIRTSNLVNGRSTKTSIRNKRRDLQGQRLRSQGHWCVRQVLADKSRTKRHRNTKIGREVAHTRANKAHQFQGQRSRSPGRLMLRSEVRRIFWTEGLRTSNLVHRWRTKTRITNKRYDLQGQRSRSQGHVMCLTGVGW